MPLVCSGGSLRGSNMILILYLQFLQDYIGVVNFEPYQNHFMLVYAQSRVVNVGIPGVPPLYGYPNRNW